MTEERFTKGNSSYHNCNICEIFIDGSFFCVSPIDYADKILDLLEENEQLKAQLYCNSDDGICPICENHYLVKGKTYEKYYISKCRKGHDECSKESLRYCEDFKVLKSDDE